MSFILGTVPNYFYAALVRNVIPADGEGLLCNPSWVKHIMWFHNFPDEPISLNMIHLSSKSYSDMSHGVFLWLWPTSAWQRHPAVWSILSAVPRLRLPVRNLSTPKKRPVFHGYSQTAAVYVMCNDRSPSYRCRRSMSRICQRHTYYRKLWDCIKVLCWQLLHKSSCCTSPNRNSVQKRLLRALPWTGSDRRRLLGHEGEKWLL